MLNTLGLDDDLDGAELVRNLEASFSVRFSDSEAASCWTVDDLYEFLKNRFASRSDGSQCCASAMAFYRIRRAYSEIGVEAKLRPTAKLEDISSLSAKALCKKIQSYTGLRLPRMPFAKIGKIGRDLFLVGLISLLVIGLIHFLHSHSGMVKFLFIPPITSLIGILLMRLDGRRYPSDCHTLGDLAQKIAWLNFGKLVAEGAGHRDKDIWNALLEVLSEHSAIPKADIRPETLLLHSQLRAA